MSWRQLFTNPGAGVRIGWILVLVAIASGAYIWWRFGTATGSAVILGGAGVGISVLSYGLGHEGKRFSFLQTAHAIYGLRRDLVGVEKQPESIERAKQGEGCPKVEDVLDYSNLDWVTWEYKRLCDQLAAVWAAASDDDRVSAVQDAVRFVKVLHERSVLTHHDVSYRNLEHVCLGLKKLIDKRGFPQAESENAAQFLNWIGCPNFDSGECNQAVLFATVNRLVLAKRLASGWTTELNLTWDEAVARCVELEKNGCSSFHRLFDDPIKPKVLSFLFTVDEKSAQSVGTSSPQSQLSPEAA